MAKEELMILNFPKFLANITPPCAESDPDAFFPQDDPEGYTRGRRYENERGAKAVCFKCPVRLDCLEYAVRNDVAGIWGGTTESERRRIMGKVKPRKTSPDR